MPRAADSVSLATELPGTALRREDWSALAERHGHWRRVVERTETESEDRIVGAIDAALHDDSLDGAHPGWVSFLRQYMPVAAFAFQACAHTLEAGAERCRSVRISDDLWLQASMLRRQAQAIVLYGMDMEHRFGSMEMDTARSQYGHDPRWMPSKQFLDDVAAGGDWCEIVVAVNLCFEPLVGQLLRLELAIGRAGDYGDAITPVVAEAGQHEWALIREWTTDFVASLMDEPTWGAANRAVIQEWITTWAPGARAACAAAASLAAELPDPSTPEPSVERLVAAHDELLTAAGLTPPPRTKLDRP